ncbi:hypothetical protein SAMN05421869_11895 [Nonomuraea jiangxiensis]|uniref:Uncharacterized protein n=1 Tax=Nonomuraea jiangxiensis TaxID=633440 RepID=A0A1G9EB23_9ACTN|nr:hypothetical protein SAMN05421869_11895 [Nonomuraea jiangxiensis]
MRRVRVSKTVAKRRLRLVAQLDLRTPAGRRLPY